jgi:hypothetical protein
LRAAVNVELKSDALRPATERTWKPIDAITIPQSMLRRADEVIE